MCRNELGLAAIDVPTPAFLLLQPQDRATSLHAAHATQEWLRKMQECAPDIIAFLQGAFRFMQHAREQSQAESQKIDFLTLEYTPRSDGQEREQHREQGNGAGSREGTGKGQYLDFIFTSKASKLNTNAGAEGAGVMVSRENGANVDKCASVEKRLGALP